MPLYDIIIEDTADYCCCVLDIISEGSENMKNEAEKSHKKSHAALVYMITSAMFAAVIAVCSQIQLPIGPVPFTLQTMGIFIAAGLLGVKGGSAAVGIYILLGAVGLPVFSGFKGGLSVLTGATGGYIIGFMFTAVIVGLLSDLLGRKVWVLAVSMTAGLLVCYAFGTAWFIIVSSSSGKSMDIAAALGYCVIPFLIPDAVKIALSVLLVNRVCAVLKKQKSFPVS